MKKYILNIICIFLTTMAVAFAQQTVLEKKIEVELPINVTQLTVGDAVKIYVAVTPEEADNVTPTTTLPEGVRLLRVHPYDKLSGKLLFEVTSYLPKKIELPKIAFARDGKTVFETEPRELEFISVLKEQEEPDGLVEPLELSLPVWVQVLIALVALVLLTTAIYFAYRKWQERRAQKLLEAELKRTPLERFEAECDKLIQRLESVSAHQQKKLKSFYFSITELTKKFLTKQLKFDAEDKTTRELAAALQQTDLGETLIAELVKYYERLDLIKFTDQHTDVEETNAMLLDSRKLMRRIHVATTFQTGDQK